MKNRKMDLLTKGLKQICASDKTAAFFIEGRLAEITELLSRYIDELERFNAAYGLVKTDSREELIVKHILDSLSPLGHIAGMLGGRLGCPLGRPSGLAGKKIADIGSGAGLPGIPLSLCLPEIQFILIERMGRRASFLLNTLAILGISNVLVEETEAEKVHPDQFDILVLRAVSPLSPAFVAKLIRLLVNGGAIAAYKGREETAKTEMDSLSGLSAELIPLNVPFLDEQRCLAVIRSLPCLV